MLVEEEEESGMRPMALEYTTEPPYRPVSYQLIGGLGRGRGRGWKSRGGGGEGEEEALKEEERRRRRRRILWSEAAVSAGIGSNPGRGWRTQLRTNKDFWVRPVLILRILRVGTIVKKRMW